MTQAIVLAFTLKGQDQNKIIEKIKEASVKYADHLCIHGFMTRKEVVEKKLPTDILDAIETYFPKRANFYVKGPLRQEMCEWAKLVNAIVVIIGEVKEGVQEEYNLYMAAGLNIVNIPL